MLEMSQTAAGIIARFRIRIASGKNFERSSRIKKAMASSKPISVVAERI